MTQATCDFVFDPDEWEAEHETQCTLEEELLEDGCWHCHRRVSDGTDYCVFHRSPEETNSTRVSRAFQSAIQNIGNTDSAGNIAQSRRFIGARIANLSLSYADLGRGSNHPIDLRYATIEDSLNLEQATVAANLLLEGSRINEINAHGCTFENRVDATGTEVDTVDFRSATFYGRVNLHLIEIKRGKLFNAKFKERAIFRGATIRETFSAKKACFEADTSFSKSTFENKSSFAEAVFCGDASFKDINIESPLSLSEIEVKSEFQFDPDSVAADVNRIDLTESHIEDGYIRYPLDSDVKLDLSRATVGTVTIGTQASTVELQRFRFIETEFKGFDFSKYTDTLVRRNWLLHSLPNANDEYVLKNAPRYPFVSRFWKGYLTIRMELLFEAEFTPGELRSTYLKAKNGAKEVGDNSAAAEFFLHEMRYKRKSYAQAFKNHHSGRALYQWLSNWGYNIAAGYGERPFRTFLFSILLIGAFSIGYLMLAPLSVVPIGSEVSQN